MEVSCLKRSADGKGGSTPPIAGILLGPTRLRTRERSMLLSPRCENPARLIQHYSAGSPRSDVDSEDWNNSSVPYRYDAPLAHYRCALLLNSHEPQGLPHTCENIDRQLIQTLIGQALP